MMPGIDGKRIKNFEDFLNRSITEGEPLLLDIDLKPKKPFLRKGSGLKKYQPSSNSRFARCCTKNRPKNSHLVSQKLFSHEPQQNYPLESIEDKTLLHPSTERSTSGYHSGGALAKYFAEIIEHKARMVNFVEMNKARVKSAGRSKQLESFEGQRMGQRQGSDSSIHQKSEKICKLDSVDAKYAPKPVSIIMTASVQG